MCSPRILLVVTFIVIGGFANAEQRSDGVGVGISYLGTRAENGRYTTEALSISVGSGAGVINAGAWTNGTNVASAVGTESTFIGGPQNSHGYESNICVGVVSCPPTKRPN